MKLHISPRFLSTEGHVSFDNDQCGPTYHFRSQDTGKKPMMSNNSPQLYYRVIEAHNITFGRTRITVQYLSDKNNFWCTKVARTMN
jgi:hypothetical protein